MSDITRQFLVPKNNAHRQYEALRALFIDELSIEEAAERFDYAPGSLANLKSRFLKKPDENFFRADRRRTSATPEPKPDRNERILALRRQHNLSVVEIAQRLTHEENLPVSDTTVYRVIAEAGLSRLWRRPYDKRETVLHGAEADRRRFDLSPRRLRTSFGGLFLFAADLARLDLDGLLAASGFPGSVKIPAGCAVRSLLGMKLWGIGRPFLVMPDVLDEGLALFAGLNAIPKRSTLTEYSGRVDPARHDELTEGWFAALDGLDQPIGGGRTFDLDFHTIPFHGEDALIEKHYVSKRSRRQRGILAFLARDAEARMFTYANADLRKADQNDEVLRFVENCRQRNGQQPDELVFDSRLTTHANLARLDAMGIRFLTLRRRNARLIDDLMDRPPADWRRITLNNVGRKYRNPKVVEQEIRLRYYPGPLRQLAIRDLGHDKPTLLITNNRTETASRLIDRYARRMVIENAIAEAIDFFHMDALSAVVPMKINLDLQLTLMASSLYRMLARRVGNGLENAKAQTLFGKLVNASAAIRITDREIVVTFGRRAHNPMLVAAGFDQIRQPIPWLENRTLRIDFS